MTVLHIISSVSRTAGGPARSVQGLVAAQCAAGIDAWLMTLNDYGDPWVAGIQNYRCAKCHGARGVRAAVEKVIDECKPDLVEVHSLWQICLHRAVVAARAKGVPYVLTPRGCLDVWSLQQKTLKKKLALLTYQGYDLRQAAAIHTTSDEESRQMRRLGFERPLLQFPNGVNLPDALPERVRIGTQRRMLFLSRMHPKKGVLELVESWARVRDGAKVRGEGEDAWCCELVYTASRPDDKAYEQKVKQRVRELGMTYSEGDNSTVHLSPSPSPKSPDFIFTGALDDDAKWEAYRRADCFVLPTHTENFGIVIAEALYAGVPVITTKGAPWSELEGASVQSPNHPITQSNNSRCGWWVGLPGEKVRGDGDGWRELDLALGEAMACGELEEMGRRGHELIVGRYSWNQIAARMKPAYEAVLENCKKSHS